MFRRVYSGFTLIELLVVISIIGLLASVVLTSLSTARRKGIDAAIIQEMKQFQILAELEYQASGSYANLQSGWWIPGGASGIPTLSCASAFSGSYASQAATNCTTIVNTIGSLTTTRNFINNNQIDTAKKYSFMAWLPGAQMYYCVGSSGVSMTADQAWGGVGCWSNP